MKYICICIICMLCMISSCTDPAGTVSSSVTGEFVTEDNRAVEGALVRVFSVKPFDTLVTRLQHEYKNIGCEISDETEFDHRFYGKPLAEGRTGTDGKFTIAGLSGGPYHISITHPAYSWRYIYRSSGALGKISTKPAIEVKGNLSGNIIWDGAGQDYILLGNALVNNSSITVGSGVRIRLGSQRKLTIQNGNLLIKGELHKPVWITSDTDSSFQNYSSGLQIVNSSVEMSGAIISGAVNGIDCREMNTTLISNCIFTNNYIGLSLVGCKNTVSIKNVNSVYSNISFLLEASKADIYSSIVAYNGNIAIKLVQTAKSIINNSFIFGKETAVVIEDQSSFDMKYSEMNSLGFGAAFLSGSSALISFTNIYAATPLITISNNNINMLQSITLSESNLFSSENKPIILLRTNSATTLDKVYFSRANTLEEYKRYIKDDYGDTKTIINNPVFVPVMGVGIPK